MTAKIIDWFSVFRPPEYRNGLKDRERKADLNRSACRKQFTDALEELEGTSATLDDLQDRLEDDNSAMREALGG